MAVAVRVVQWRRTMWALLFLAFVVLIGVLALFFGKDSRLSDDGWRGWPTYRG